MSRKKKRRLERKQFDPAPGTVSPKTRIKKLPAGIRALSQALRVRRRLLNK